MPFIEIPIDLTEFQRFDRGEEITQLVSADFDIKAGDTVGWESAQFHGDVKIISCSPSILPAYVDCVLKKLD